MHGLQDPASAPRVCNCLRTGLCRAARAGPGSGQPTTCREGWQVRSKQRSGSGAFVSLALITASGQWGMEAVASVTEKELA